MDLRGKILVLDDDPAELKCVEHSVNKLGFQCFCTTRGTEALDLLARVRPDLVLTDMMMPEIDGLTFLKKAKRIDPGIIVILLTAYGSINSAIEAMKSGAADYLQKPYSAEQLRSTIQQAIDAHGGLRGENGRSEEIVGESQAIEEVHQKLRRISQSEANVLIYGESGTGKELFARSIHAHSNRRANAFIPVDCVALPESLLESELFGYEKGAFTGADAMKKGLLEYADKGTLFLDEICELAPNLQAKLLRVLQEREFRRIGGKSLIQVDIRVISATNRRPEEAVRSGQFREDLYYRLNVIPFELPPLRERAGDIPLLFDYYLSKFCKSRKLPPKSVGPDVMAALSGYTWPGNVRELKNLAERLVSLLDGDRIGLADLPDYIIDHKGASSYCPDNYLPFLEARKRRVEDFEKEYIVSLLKQCQGNISKAAELARVSRRTMYRMIRTHNLEGLV